MSIPLPLVVPMPDVTFKPIGGTFASLEGVVSIAFASVLFPDGTPLTKEETIGAHALLFRTAAQGSPLEVWDAATKTWVLEGNVDLSLLKGLGLLPPETGTEPWKGVLVGAGQTDANGAPLLEAAAGNFPLYSLRGAFLAKRGEDDAFGLGPDSVPLAFASAAAIVPPFGAELTPAPETATRVRLMLRNAAQQTVGALEIDASAGNAAITLQNFDAVGTPLASITLQPDGNILLSPLATRKVIIAGDLQTGRINYLSGGAPTDLA